MELISLALSIISLSGVGFSFYFFKREIEKLRKELSKQRAIFNKFVVEDIMFAEDAKSKNLFRENVVNLARKIFVFLKRRYGLKSTNYAELVEELKNIEIKPSLKEELIDFFNSIILLEYSKESLNELQKRKLKRKAIEMIRKMGQIPTLQE